jgi:hypothetical protein
MSANPSLFADLLREARDELDAWRRFAQVRGMGAAKTHEALISRIDAALTADQADRIRQSDPHANWERT